MTYSYPVFIEPGTGKEYLELPDPWNGRVSPLTADNCEQFGWVVEERSGTAPDPVVVYSKLKLVRNLKAAGLWDEVKSSIEEAGLWDEFTLAQDLASDDASFSPMLAVFASRYGEQTVEEILRASMVE